MNKAQREVYALTAATFRNAFAQLSDEEIHAAMAKMGSCSIDLLGEEGAMERSKKLLFEEYSAVSEGPMWAFVLSCAGMVLMTELDRRRIERERAKSN
jgi:hypothetical protein